MKKTPLLVLGMCFVLYPVHAQTTYVLIGWNDLGMHCSNKDFSKIAVLPPYNNIYAQLIRKVPGQAPEVITSGITVSYSIPTNTYSVGKTDFWTYAMQLFGLAQPLPPDIGLTGKGLADTLDPQGDHFVAAGIPVTPFPDTSLTVENPYQLIHLEARATGSTAVLASTDCVIPVSNDMGCVSSSCHASEQAILNGHESVPGFNPNGPVLCAGCHADPALGTAGNSGAPPFSEAMHSRHAELGLPNTLETCFLCHPGKATQCLRGAMVDFSPPTPTLMCENCHGTLANVGATIAQGRRPWIDEPRCGSCHDATFAETTGLLFKQSKGHGGLYCSACHGSPHAIFPTRIASDNVQSIHLQGSAGTISKCIVCHDTNPTGAGPHGILVAVDLQDEGKAVPGRLSLLQNYPNPFNPSTTIRYSLPQHAHVSLTVYSVLGRQAAALFEGEQEAGYHEMKFDAAGLSSGVYFYRLTAGSYVQTRKLLLLR